VSDGSVGSAAGVIGPAAVPQEEQKRAPALTSAPQVEQLSVRPRPHAVQKRALSALSVEQYSQRLK
jgi:hypothetical protein